MSKAFERLKEEVRRRGGVSGSTDMPEELAEIMLQEILDCPLCEDLARRNERRPAEVDH